MGLISETEFGYQVDGPHRGRGHEQSHMILFYFKETRQTFSATWRCISLRFNAIIFDFLKTFFSVGERLLYSLSHFFLQTVSILEQRLTMTENKL